jgi:hypothetical protein
MINLKFVIFLFQKINARHHNQYVCHAFLTEKMSVGYFVAGATGVIGAGAVGTVLLAAFSTLTD